MASIASELSDKVFSLITQEMRTLISLRKWKKVSRLRIIKVLAITDRKQAIKTACQLAQPNDII
jgi:UDP-N-acetylmuramoyl-L-alanyl-D-glutamate--2,6-diaminopimelate ligase